MLIGMAFCGGQELTHSSGSRCFFIIAVAGGTVNVVWELFPIILCQYSIRPGFFEILAPRSVSNSVSSYI